MVFIRRIVNSTFIAATTKAKNNNRKLTTPQTIPDIKPLKPYAKKTKIQDPSGEQTPSIEETTERVNTEGKNCHCLRDPREKRNVLPKPTTTPFRLSKEVLCGGNRLLPRNFLNYQYRCTRHKLSKVPKSGSSTPLWAKN